MSDWVDVLAAALCLLAAAYLAYRHASWEDLADINADLIISKILVYPIKSCSAIDVTEGKIAARGFEHDREFMLVSPSTDGNSWENHHIKTHPQNSLIIPEIVGEELVCKSIHAKGEFRCRLKPDTANLEIIDTVDMWRSPAKGVYMGKAAEEWFSQACGQPTKLIYMPPETSRAVLGNVSGEKKAGVTWADCASYLVASQASLNSLSDMVGSEVSILPLRPNILVEAAPGVTTDAFEEDYWTELKIGEDTTFRLTANCARCSSIDIDYSTGKAVYEKNKTYPLKAMMKTRRVDKGMKYSPVFGRYAFCEQVGRTIKVGDSARITKRQTEQSTFYWPGLSTGSK